MDHYGLADLSAVDLLVTDFIRLKRWFNSGPAYNASEFDYLKLKLDIDPRRIVVISHHMAHAASAFYPSGFDEAAILVIDGNGSDLQTTSFLQGENGKISYLDSHKAHGIGGVYNAVTMWILALGDGGEGKTMGLAPFGRPHAPVLHIDGRLDGIKTDFSRFMRRMPYSDVLNQIDARNRINPLKVDFRRCEDPKDLLDPYFARVAYDVQQETERVMVHLGRSLRARTGSPNLGLAGGVALNSVANKIMFDATDFERMFVFPACSDAGIPFGLALWGYYNAAELGDFPRRRLTFRNAYTGIPYPPARAQAMFARHSITHRRTNPAEVARLLADDAIVGWFQGASEYGPRALGNRSILADPRRSETKDILNHRVKHRESFRPYAPAVMAEHCAEYFEIEGESPYMLLVAKVKKPDVIPAVTHVDGSARVQTVTREDNGPIYDLIAAFKEITGVPVILNTSFNDAGEPIVETPEDAMICFLGTEMDYLILGDYLVRAADVDKPRLAEAMRAERERAMAAREKECIARFFTGYDSEECRHFIDESNSMSVWHTRYRSKYELEKQVLRWSREGTRVLIVGSRDHTALLRRHINGLWNVDVVGFVDHDGRPDLKVDGAPLPYPEGDWEAVREGDFDEILISSHEYMYDIAEALRAQGVTAPVYEIYDNASRSFLDTLVTLPPFKVDAGPRCRG